MVSNDGINLDVRGLCIKTVKMGFSFEVGETSGLSVMKMRSQTYGGRNDQEIKKCII